MLTQQIMQPVWLPDECFERRAAECESEIFATGHTSDEFGWFIEVAPLNQVNGYWQEHPLREKVSLFDAVCEIAGRLLIWTFNFVGARKHFVFLKKIFIALLKISPMAIKCKVCFEPLRVFGLST